jgi:radical SAM superfamily enzyme YgiQ (UPF0313 family)
MNILLISVNRERMPAPVFPLGLACVAGALKKEAHAVEVLDLCFSRDVAGDLQEAVTRFQPELIGLSLRNLDNLTYPASISYLKEAEEVISTCRQVSCSTLVIGGSGFSLAPQELLRHLDVDFGIVGEGEEILLALLNSFEKKLPIPSSPHLLIKRKPTSSIISGAKVVQLSTPDRTLFKARRYLEEGGMLNLQTKRGCPFSCIYCTYPLLEGRRVRLREVDEVIEEIRHLVQEQGTDYLYFVDDIFNFPVSFAQKLCRRMAHEKLRVQWSAFVNPGFLDEDLLKWMIEAGCTGIEFGTDSGSPRMLQIYRKSFTVEDVARASQLCSKLIVNHCHYLLFGGPGEEEETLEESFRLMDQLDPTAVIAMLGIRIYPGTELEQLSISQGVIDRETNLIYPHFYISPGLKDRLGDILREEALKRKQWIVPGLEINITQNLMEQIRRFRVRGPLWELVGRMKRPRIRPLKE